MINPLSSPPWVIALTGASGTCYARRLIQLILENFPQVHLELVFSEAAIRVLREEDGLTVSVGTLKLEHLLGNNMREEYQSRIRIHANRNIGAPIASGSFRTSGMIIVPCSMRTLAAVANGVSDNLIQRAADVTIKERRPLFIVPRETPFSAIHLRNMLQLSEMNVGIIPAIPGFYQRPQSIEELVDHFVFRLLDHMNLPLPFAPRWGETGEEMHVSKRAHSG